MDIADQSGTSKIEGVEWNPPGESTAKLIGKRRVSCRRFALVNQKSDSDVVAIATCITDTLKPRESYSYYRVLCEYIFLVL